MAGRPMLVIGTWKEFDRYIQLFLPDDRAHVVMHRKHEVRLSDGRHWIHVETEQGLRGMDALVVLISSDRRYDELIVMAERQRLEIRDDRSLMDLTGPARA